MKPMTSFRLLLRNLVHHWRANLAVVAGMAVATAVLTGAMFVGDSVRGSLANLAIDRLGPVDYALASPTLFEQSLGKRLTTQPDFTRYFEPAVVGLTVQGGVSGPQGDGGAEKPPRRTGDVQIAALSDWLTVPPGHCVLNGRLADDIGARIGDSI
ncbi:MAG: hypothetical protein PHU85_18180, partial [Phycisphaerae bacterium]|nr:hypothetical protein [Phycisphaerae bacterium]